MPRPRWLLPFSMQSWEGYRIDTMGFSGKSKIKKGNSKCLFASLRQGYQSNYWSYHYLWGERGMSQRIHGFYRARGRSYRFWTVLWPVRNQIHRDSLSKFAHWHDLWRLNRYISNIEMAGGIIKYVPLQPPTDGATKTSSAADWKLDFDLLAKAFSPKTQMIVRSLPI